MRHPRPYQYEIIIPIKLRIPIYIEPVVIDASSCPASSPDTLNTDPPTQSNAHAIQTPVFDPALTTSNLNVRIQPELPRSILRLVSTSISAAMVQVLSWTFSQICPSVFHNSLLRSGLEAGHPSLFRSVPTDGSARDIEPIS